MGEGVAFMGLTSLLSGLLGSSASQANTQESIAAQKQMQQAQNDWNLQMWNKTNEYNSASSQLQRWTAAGFSPASMLQGGSNLGNASSLSASEQGSLPVADASMIAPALTAAAQMQQSQPLIDAQVNKTAAETKAISEKLPYEIKLTEKMVDKFTQEINTSISQEHINWKNLSWIDENQRGHVAALRMQALNSFVSSCKIALESDWLDVLNRQQIELGASQIALNKANARMSNSLSSKYDMETQWMPKLNQSVLNVNSANARLGNANAWSQENQNKWSKDNGSPFGISRDNLLLQGTNGLNNKIDDLTVNSRVGKALQSYYKFLESSPEGVCQLLQNHGKEGLIKLSRKLGVKSSLSKFDSNFKKFSNPSTNALMHSQGAYKVFNQ